MPIFTIPNLLCALDAHASDGRARLLTPALPKPITSVFLGAAARADGQPQLSLSTLQDWIEHDLNGNHMATLLWHRPGGGLRAALWLRTGQNTFQILVGSGTPHSFPDTPATSGMIRLAAAPDIYGDATLTFVPVVGTFVPPAGLSVSIRGNGKIGISGMPSPQFAAAIMEDAEALLEAAQSLPPMSAPWDALDGDCIATWRLGNGNRAAVAGLSAMMAGYLDQAPARLYGLSVMGAAMNAVGHIRPPILSPITIDGRGDYTDEGETLAHAAEDWMHDRLHAPGCPWPKQAFVSNSTGFPQRNPITKCTIGSTQLFAHTRAAPISAHDRLTRRTAFAQAQTW